MFLSYSDYCTVCILRRKYDVEVYFEIKSMLLDNINKKTTICKLIQMFNYSNVMNYYFGLYYSFLSSTSIYYKWIGTHIISGAVIPSATAVSIHFYSIWETAVLAI